jgi:fimbrial chaperone protein
MRTPHLHAAFVAGLVVAMAGFAQAGDFQVAPTHLELAKRGTATELSITNRGKTASRFEAKVFAWRQDEQGVMQLDPTTDVVVYPTLFTIEAGSTRAIRIATSTLPGAAEKTYRIFVEELPPRQLAAAPATIAVRARIGVPIYLAPTKSTTSGAITGEIAAGALHFAVENHGTVHVKVGTVRVVGTDRAGKTVFDRTQPSWYLLAGGTRRHELVLDRGTCRSIDRILIESATDRGTWATTLAMPAGGCSSAP